MYILVAKTMVFHKDLSKIKSNIDVYIKKRRNWYEVLLCTEVSVLEIILSMCLFNFERVQNIIIGRNKLKQIKLNNYVKLRGVKCRKR